jgi:hypothetical protein
MTNPFKDAFEMLPELEKIKDDAWPTLYRHHIRRIITALSACRGLADGSEVIVNVAWLEKLKARAGEPSEKELATLHKITGNPISVFDAIIAPEQEFDTTLAASPQEAKP